jgi:hypothetical protein
VHIIQNTLILSETTVAKRAILRKNHSHDAERFSVNQNARSTWEWTWESHKRTRLTMSILTKRRFPTVNHSKYCWQQPFEVGRLHVSTVLTLNTPSKNKPLAAQGVGRYIDTTTTTKTKTSTTYPAIPVVYL